MSDTDYLRVDREHRVFWHGREVGVLATPIHTDFHYTEFPFRSYRLLEINFKVAETTPPPPAPKPKRTWARSMGLRRPNR